MNILVTGGAGFIGSFLVDELIKQRHKVTVYDNLDPQVHIGSKKPYYLNKKAEFIKGDVCDYNKLKKIVLDKEIIFHFAEKVGVGQSQYEIKRYVDVNIGGTSNLLDIISNNQTKLKKLIVAGSMSSYGEGMYKCVKCGLIKPDLRTEEQMSKNLWELYCPKCSRKISPVPTSESATQNCNSIYAITKKVQEEMTMIIGKAYKIPVVVLRFFNVYGPRQSLSNPYTGVCAIFMSRIKNNNSPVIFEDGLQTRDFIYVTDIVKACILVMNSEKANYEIFNVGTGIPVTILEISKILAKLYGKKILPEVTNRFRKGDVRHCYADISKIKKVVGFRPEIRFNEGMKLLVDWAKSVDAIDMYDKAENELKKRNLV